MITIEKKWICYNFDIIVHIEYETMFVGACNAASFPNLPDANRNSLFVQTMKQDLPWRVTVNGIFDTAETAIATQELLIASMRTKPWFNTQGQPLPAQTNRSRSTPLISSEGTTYPSARHAAQSLGVSAAAISQHLKGTLKTVAGVTLTRVGD
jgi:hypothetical protein